MSRYLPTARWIAWAIGLAVTLAWPHSIDLTFVAGILFGAYLFAGRTIR